MRKKLALVTAAMFIMTGCSQPREHSSVEVTPPPVLEIPKQTIYHQALTAVMHEDAIITTGLPAIEALEMAAQELQRYEPTPTECAGIVDSQLYDTTDIALGFHSEIQDDEHILQTVVALGFSSAEDASQYFTARTAPWVDCQSVDLTIDETNTLTLQYEATGFTDAEELDIPEHVLDADQDMILTSSGELSGAFETTDIPVPDPGSLPDYVISPDEVPEPDVENISISNTTVIARYDDQVFWVTVEPGGRTTTALETLAEIIETVQTAQ